ncbi:MAG: family type secretion target [Jatrophihabitans sp.]|jgi:early secretory antigenic target protein ESAT-6|nr:family type secretion target [Jatrophihabitans sp.]MCW2656798.1 family type secretion target [Jatrophihabitans sp.]MDT4905303.1 6 kDa early secretory antigenic target [Pseudonocardiales bacterium]MDT4928964.1 6 kDa early secretory antigenic target [Pseudonocardiales bacterium]MDT4949998.1 6 kDa early secretory antigenic target [Pseudonocardiales bacterium]
MGEIQVNFQALQAGQDGVRQTYNRLQATLEELEADLKPMIESWTGSAQESYLACKRQWDDGARSLAAVLESVSRAVGTANENYRATHNATMQIWT